MEGRTAPLFAWVPSEATFARGSGARLPVVDEDVERAVRVARDQVAGHRLKRHEAAVGADGGRLTAAVGLGAIGGHTHPGGGAGLLTGVCQTVR